MENSPRDANDRPVRRSLVDQAADHIRRGLLKDRWGGDIPPEKELVRELGVSRGTLRRALAVLFEEGILMQGGRGGRHKVVAKLRENGRGSGRADCAGNIVRILSPQPRIVLGDKTQFIFQIVSEELGRVGLNLEFEHHAGLWKLRRPDSKMLKITARKDTACWLLYRSTEAIQKWFVNSGLPTVAIGGIYPGIPLANAEFDFVAVSRHAAGIFAARGRKRLVFLTVEKATAGDQASARAFEEAAVALGLHAETVVFDDTVKGLCLAIDKLLVGGPAPDGFLTGFSNHAPATIGHLNRRGYAVPKKACVISRMDSNVLEESIPTIARYQMDGERFSKTVARSILREVDADWKSEPKSHVIIPDFVDGESAGGKSDF